MKINNEDFPKCPHCGESKFVYHKKILGIRKEGLIPIEEIKKCRKCGGEIELKWISQEEILNYPGGYLTLLTCKNCGEKRINDGTILSW